MLKKIQSNKKLLVFGAIIIVLAIATGVTYAWFTSKASIADAVQMGTLKISASLLDDPDLEGYVYQPGEEFTRTGVVQNEGSLDCIVMVTKGENGKFVIKSDDNGEPAGTWQEISGEAALEYYSIDLSTGPKGYKVNGDGSMYMWAQVGESDDYVLLLSGNVQAPVEYSVAFDGEKMGNKFQNAEVHLDTEWTATQILDGATQSLFGFEWSDLNFIDVDLEAEGYSLFRAGLSASQRHDMFLAKLQELEAMNA